MSQQLYSLSRNTLVSTRGQEIERAAVLQLSHHWIKVEDTFFFSHRWIKF